MKRSKSLTKLTVKKVLIICLLIILSFSVFKIGKAFADTETFSITNVQIIEKSETVEVKDIEFTDNKVISNVVMHEVGDSYTCRITIKNNDETDYTIDSITNSNGNEFIKYEYEDYSGTIMKSNESKDIDITVVYAKEQTDTSNRNLDFSMNFIINIADDEGNEKQEEIEINPATPEGITEEETAEEKSEEVLEPEKAIPEKIINKIINPQTGDNVGIYIITAIISSVVLIILSKKKTVKTTVHNEINTKSVAKAVHSTKYIAKHMGKGFKMFGMLLIVGIFVPTISKAFTTSISIAFENSVQLMSSIVVNIDTDGDGVLEEITVRYNELLGELEAPEKEGYIFEGWQLEDGTEFNPEADAITEDITIKPKFTIKKYTITLELNGGEGETSVTKEYGEKIESLPKPSRLGYTFEGWYTTNEEGEKVDETAAIKEEATYYAHWTPVTYAVVLNANGGEGDEVTTIYTYDIPQNLPANEFTRDGYKFANWNIDPDGKGQTYENEEEILNLATEGTVTLYAQWAVTPYTIIFYKNDEQATGTMENMSVQYGETIVLTANSYEKDNYKVRGWNTKADGTGIHYDDKAEVKNLSINGEITLYAEWSEISATFASGSTVNEKLKKLVTPNANISTYDSTVTSIKRFTGNVDESQFTSANIISDSSSVDPIYAWYEQESTTIYWWTIDTYPKLNTDASNMFYRFSSAIEIDVSTINTENTTNMKSMFQGCQKITELDVTGFNTSNVTDMESMFNYCATLIELDLSSFDTSNVTNMKFMFFSCDRIIELDLSSFDTSNVINMNSMFGYMLSVREINLSTFNTSKVTDMSSMFYRNNNLQNLNLSGFDTSNVTSMGAMFFDCCYGLNVLDISNFDTSKVTNMSNMFDSCKNLTELNMSNFDTSNVRNMSYMFNGCSRLTELNMSNFDTSKVTNMSYMFSGCSGLTESNMSNFDTTNVTNMSYMFSGCRGLTELNMSNFDTSKVTNMSYMFENCTNLEKIYVSDSFITTKVNNSTGMFNGCTNLVGGAGTTYDLNFIDKTYAHIDGGVDNPGYFTDIEDK